MKVKYRVVKDFERADTVKLKALGIEVEEGFDAFVIDIDHPDLNTVKAIIGDEWDESVSYETEFSEDDRRNAPYLHVYPQKMFGYPQPESSKEPFPFDQYPYYKEVFEIENTDAEYGVLKGKQIGSFRFKKEPAWGSSAIGSAFWIQDFIFVKPDVYARVFAPLNINSLPAVEYKTKKALKSIVQLVPQGMSNAELDIKAEKIDETEEVDSWGIRKYILNAAGYYPGFKSDPGDLDFFVTREFFGSGGQTDHAVIISQKLYRLLVESGIKGLEYEPMKA